MREGIAIVTGKRKALGLGQGRGDVAGVEGEGKGAAGLRHRPLGLLRKG